MAMITCRFQVGVRVRLVAFVNVASNKERVLVINENVFKIPGFVS